MSTVTRAEWREAAKALWREHGAVNYDVVARALAETESAAYARGLADGAERERAAVVAYLHESGLLDGPKAAVRIESGKHLEKSE